MSAGLFPACPESSVPFLTTEQMVEVDRAMIQDYGIQLIQMMENAGRNLAELARRRLLGGDPRGKKVMVMAGSGGNGGGALVCARRLRTWGADVHVALAAKQESFAEVPAHQLGIVRAMNLPILESPEATADFDLIVDGIIGYSLRGAPRERAAQWIAWANQHDAPTLSLDVPSGINTTTGQVYEPTIAAVATMTLALPKEGLRAQAARARVGELYLADISVPPSLYASTALRLEVGSVFAGNDIVQLVPDSP